MLRQPGQRLREQLEIHVTGLFFYIGGALVVAWVIALAEWILLWIGRPTGPQLPTIMAISLTVIAAVGFRRWFRRAKALARGERGERLVAHILDELAEHGYRAIHDVPVKLDDGRDVNIDHVLIGPAGVFAIETKFRSGNPQVQYNGKRILVEGREEDRDALSQARASAASTREIIERVTGRTGRVRAVVLYANCRVTTRSGADEWVLAPTQLKAWIKQEERWNGPKGAILDRESINACARAIESHVIYTAAQAN